MTIQQQQKMLDNGRLILSKKRKIRHYEISLFGFGITILVLLLGIWDLINGNSEKFTQQISILIFLFVATSLSSWNQCRKLKFTKFKTGQSKEENYQKINDSLNWKVQVNNKYFIEAINPKREDMRTWGDEMVSILISDKEIFVNSICNLDYKKSQAFLSLGKNKENVNKLLEEIEK